MAIIQTSNKLSLRQEEFRICSKPYVFFRLIAGRDGVRLMTATAAEDTAEYRAYENQASLISATSRAFEDRSLNYETKNDLMGRSYVETSVYPDKNDLLHLAATVLDQIGFEDISVLALREMKAIYDGFSVDDSGEYTYLSDGIWITSDGRLIEK